jgi:hypothetical protein
MDNWQVPYYQIVVRDFFVRYGTMYGAGRLKER